MTWANEEKGDNGQPKKSELLPTGDQAKEIIEVLAAMYRAMQNPEDATNDEDGSAHATSEDAGLEKEEEEETRWGLYGSENGPPFPKC